jgi:hypothetical protein
MTVEAAIERPVHAGAEDLPKRQSVLTTVALWAISTASIGFTMCYAYHIGL